MKKRDILIITSVLLLLFLAFIRDYITINRYGKYAIGTTRKMISSKGYNKTYYYDFIVDEKKYKGNYSVNFLNADIGEIGYPDGKYLVIYSEKDPDMSILLGRRPVTDSFKLDSLNELGLDKNDYSWRDF